MADYLDDYLTVLGPSEMRLLRWLGEHAAGGQRLHPALVELLPVAHKERAREDGDDPLVGVKMRQVPKARWEPHTEDVDPGLQRITGKYRELGARPRGFPRELIGRHPHRLKRLGMRDGGDEQRESGHPYDST